MIEPAARPRHVPVLGREVLAWLEPRESGVYVDATFGAGGYSRAILQTPEARVIGIDRDRTAIAGGFDLVDRSQGRLTLVEDRFSNLAEVCAAQGVDAVDGVVMDIGVSSMQLDEAGRGFSFRADGPLDMRMGQDGPSAADVIAKASEADLANIIYIFGEERHSRSVARAIVAARKEAPITSSMANSTNCIWRFRRRKPCSGLAAGWSWCRSIRWKIASSRTSSTSVPKPAAARGISPRRCSARRALPFSPSGR
jgi:16S rRNA (cytosine1402-N4)-methyltransferase